MLAKDLCPVSEDLVRQPTGLHQEAEALVSRAKGLREKPKDLVSLAKGLYEKPKDVYPKPNGVYAMPEDICRYSRFLVQETVVLLRMNKDPSFFSKSSAALSKRDSRVPMPLQFESQDLFVEPEKLGR